MKLPPLKPGEYHWIDRQIFARGTRHGPVKYGCSYTIPLTIARLYKVGRRRRELAAYTITSARNLLARRRSQVAEKDFTFLEPPVEAAIDVATLAARYLEDRRATRKSWAFDEARLKRFGERLGALLIADVTPDILDRYRAARACEVSPRTVNHELQVIALMFKTAIRWGMLDRNPADGARRLKVRDKPIRVLSEDEEKRLLEHAAPHLRDLIVLILHTGLRRSEALGLRARNVDLKGRVLTVVGKGDKLRAIPLNDTSSEILARRLGGRGDYVFSWEGEPIKDVKVAWNQAKRRAGVEGITIHNLRDTFATRAVHLGVNLVTLKSLLGHATIDMTAKYAHPTPEANLEAVGLMQKRYGRSGTRR